MQPVAFVSGKYTGKTEAEVEKHIEEASIVAGKLWDMGYFAFCPHLNSAHLERHCKNTPYEAFLGMCFWIIPYCDLMVMVEGWEASNGAPQERKLAGESQLIVYDRVEDVPDVKAFVREQYNQLLKLDKEKTV